MDILKCDTHFSNERKKHCTTHLQKHPAQNKKQTQKVHGQLQADLC